MIDNENPYSSPMTASTASMPVVIPFAYFGDLVQWLLLGLALFELVSLPKQL